MRYAQILNSRVHCIFEDTLSLEELGKQKYNLNQIALVDISTAEFDAVQEGWNYDGVVFTNTDVLTLEEMRRKCVKAAGAEFACRRDAITYVTQPDGAMVYGYDRQTADIVNFMAARERAKSSGVVPYKVHKPDGTKSLVNHTLAMFDTCLNQSATEQLAAYQWFEALKAQLEAATTIEELEQIYPLKG